MKQIAIVVDPVTALQLGWKPQEARGAHPNDPRFDRRLPNGNVMLRVNPNTDPARYAAMRRIVLHLKQLRYSAN